MCEVFPWQNVWIWRKYIWVINFTHRSISFPLVGQKEDKHTILSLIFVFINNKSWSSLGCSKQTAKPWLNWLTSSSPLPSTPSPPSSSPSSSLLRSLAPSSHGWSKPTARPWLSWPSIAQLVDQQGHLLPWTFNLQKFNEKWLNEHNWLIFKRGGTLNFTQLIFIASFPITDTILNMLLTHIQWVDQNGGGYRWEFSICILYSHLSVTYFEYAAHSHRMGWWMDWSGRYWGMVLKQRWDAGMGNKNTMTSCTTLNIFLTSQ